MVRDIRSEHRFLLVGGGVAALAAAAFLIRDAKVPGDRIRVLEAGIRPGGALLSGRAPARRPPLYLGNALRSMDERTSPCLWDLLGALPALADPRATVLDDVLAARHGFGPGGEARLLGADHRGAPEGCPDRPGSRTAAGRASRAAADGAARAATDRSDLLASLRAPDQELAGRRIDQVLSAGMLTCDFWILWSTTFRLRPGSSALDLKTSLLRHPLDLARLRSFAGLRRTRHNEYESIIRPLHSWLQRQGVTFTHGTTVTGIDVAQDARGGRRATGLRFVSRGTPNSLDLGPHGHVLATLGGLTANAAHGDDDHPPEPDLVHRDDTWRLWESLALKHPDLGRPAAFTSRVEDTAWLSFTLSSTTEDLNWYVSYLTGVRDGAGPITFRDSPWLLSLAVPCQPRFTGQLPCTRTALGSGMRLDAPGAHVPVTLARATGQELVDELLGHLGNERVAAVVRAATSARSLLLPYAGSPVLPRSPGDRPAPVPDGARNFAFLGQYVEIPGDVPFSMEYSVRSAMHAVYGLLGVDHEIPGGFRDPGDLLVSVHGAAG